LFFTCFHGLCFHGPCKRIYIVIIKFFGLVTLLFLSFSSNCCAQLLAGRILSNSSGYIDSSPCEAGENFRVFSRRVDGGGSLDIEFGPDDEFLKSEVEQEVVLVFLLL
jgi:hypothetical protein